MAKIYPISPPQIVLADFLPKLREVLEKHKPDYFQLRLKDISRAEIVAAAKAIIPICHKHGTKFIMNDFVDLAHEVGADGVHLGFDEFIDEPKLNFTTIGVSCYNSIDMAIEAVNRGATMVSFGAFYPTKTKIVRAKAEIETLQKFKAQMPNVETAVIGGINFENLQPLAIAGADQICMISSVWDQQKN